MFSPFVTASIVFNKWEGNWILDHEILINRSSAELEYSIRTTIKPIISGAP